MKYRKKPVVIEAILVHELGHPQDILDFIGTHSCTVEIRDNVIQCVKIRTLEGTMRADIGDWIIKGVKGEFYPCKPDIFEATYEPVRE